MLRHITSKIYNVCYRIKQKKKIVTVLFPGNTIVKFKNINKFCQIL